MLLAGFPSVAQPSCFPLSPGLTLNSTCFCYYIAAPSPQQHPPQKVEERVKGGLAALPRGGTWEGTWEDGPRGEVADPAAQGMRLGVAPAVAPAL